MPPTEEEALNSVKSLFESFGSVDIVDLTHEHHKEGYEHQVTFEITYPKPVDPPSISGRHSSIGGPFKWLKVNTGVNETSQSGMTGIVRCYYRT